MTSALGAKRLSRLDVQGFDTVDEDLVAQVAPWLRLAFGLCATLAIAGTTLASTTLLLALAGIAFLAAVFPVHPFDLIYNHGIRYATGTPPLPKRGPPQSIHVRSWRAVGDRNGGGVRVVVHDRRLCSGIHAGWGGYPGKHYGHLYSVHDLPGHLRRPGAPDGERERVRR